MPFVKTVKSDAYFSRYQVKYRRRREGKTDYYARKRLVSQAKNKYNAPKYRLVVRFTNKDIIVQIIHAKIQGDFTHTAAYAHELPRYGITQGLTNWSAAYCVGLLAARRALKKFGLDDKYEGVTEPDGTMALVEPLEDGPRPFKAYLDVGLKRTTTGSKVFAALKGASDGGIYIPHNEKRFPGYDAEAKELDSEILQKYIVGGHVAEFMEELNEEDHDRYTKQFSRYIADEVSAEDIEDLYAAAHEAIRENPEMEKTPKDDLEKWKAASKKYRTPRLTKAQREEKVKAKIEAYAAGKGSDDE